MDIKYTVQENTRIDQFLTQELVDFTRSKIKKLIQNGKILLNGIPVNKPGEILRGSGIIKIISTDIDVELKPWENSGLLNVLKETDDYLVINKPSGLSVHPGAGNTDRTLANILIAEVENLSEADSRPGIVHRLDKNTSGLMVIAKNNEFHEHLAKQFEERHVEKVYVGITVGNNKNTKGMIDAPIGRNVIDRKTMEVTTTNSKEALTIFNVIERYKDFDITEFRILTGRTHQIRVHAKYIGHPLLGDSEYGNPIDKHGQYLHSKSITFLDLDNKEISTEVETPEYFQEKLKEIKEK